MHVAAFNGQAAAAELLLTVAPEMANARNNRRWLPIHMAAHNGHNVALRLLLAAAPAGAMSPNEDGWLPAHVAALHGHADALSILLAAAPEAATKRNNQYNLPIMIALDYVEDGAKRPATVRALLPYYDASLAAQYVYWGGPQLLPLFTDLVLAHLPLGDSTWQLLPAQCPGLGRALSYSTDQASRLVRRLPSADMQRLQAFALSLASAQRCLQCHLPQPLVWHILSLFDA